MKEFSILLVDDEKEILENLEYDLRELKTNIDLIQNIPVSVFFEFASNGKDALKKIETSHYDCILTDINLPGMSGLELVRKVREMGFKYPIIFLTGHEDQKKLEKELKSFHALDLINKPYNKDDLLYLFSEAYFEAIELAG